MGSEPSGEVYLPDSVRTAVKVLVVGPFAVGKSTFVNTLSEIEPLHTEETMTRDGAVVDDLHGITDKTTTTVALDFGRRTLSDRVVLYMFGTPGQQRFLSMWEDLAHGALGALVLADVARLEESFDVISVLEERGLPYGVAINDFNSVDIPSHEELREAFDLLPEIPLVTCDARDRSATARAMISLVEHVLASPLQHAQESA
ncbi:signal recognition particle receptor subunit beta [Actinopolyspora lacussalsi]|uniref:Signal recognition particle receptor subunit beta, a GTPase n=2 Tax=Actinopolyspora alba group TaxID=2893675 RepID=A0A1I2CG16_9ACTN|nr:MULTISPECIES: ATP/GTP-binding protein [Actinopolyspora alba group]MDP9641125.1 signal recognition particle receptor subunit beta [Actinopolyspora lacussalsi]SFE66680.1 Signal recognition particle receptor subunit beta, a GTPase [Actinopolyspora alba]SFT33503.1 Signal recognition particle receptor subunit beta, a GTPase [Actinopolyspora righensis]